MDVKKCRNLVLSAGLALGLVGQVAVADNRTALSTATKQATKLAPSQVTKLITGAVVNGQALTAGQLSSLGMSAADANKALAALAGKINLAQATPAQKSFLEARIAELAERNQLHGGKVLTDLAGMTSEALIGTDTSLGRTGLANEAKLETSSGPLALSAQEKAQALRSQGDVAYLNGAIEAIDHEQEVQQCSANGSELCKSLQGTEDLLKTTIAVATNPGANKNLPSEVAGVLDSVVPQLKAVETQPLNPQLTSKLSPSALAQLQYARKMIPALSMFNGYYRIGGKRASLFNTKVDNGTMALEGNGQFDYAQLVLGNLKASGVPAEVMRYRNPQLYSCKVTGSAN